MSLLTQLIAVSMGTPAVASLTSDLVPNGGNNDQIEASNKPGTRQVAQSDACNFFAFKIVAVRVDLASDCTVSRCILWLNRSHDGFRRMWQLLQDRCPQFKGKCEHLRRVNDDNKRLLPLCKHSDL